jgi:hypothetical protein
MDKRNGSNRLINGWLMLALSIMLTAVTVLLLPHMNGHNTKVTPEQNMIVRGKKSVEPLSLLGVSLPKTKSGNWHPPHVLKVWMAEYKGRTFRVIQLPHCEHLNTLITYNRSGETMKQAMLRTGGIAACTGSFHNSQSMALADFLQRDGAVISPARTGRNYMAVYADGKLDISGNYGEIRGRTGVNALALGQRLLPLQQDGFSTLFMNKKTDRMALALNKNFIFIVQGKTDIWRLASFIKNKLPARAAINCDGGHVVRGKGPVHIVFRWNTAKHIVASQTQRK